MGTEISGHAISNMRKCLYCKKEFFSKVKKQEGSLLGCFCSGKCALTHRNKQPEFIKRVKERMKGNQFGVRKLRPEECEARRQRNLGEKSHFWKGGVTNENKIIRASLEYRKWRELVFERDDYTCQFCNKRGGKIQADHIKPFAFHPELRFEISNGRTLCIDCHMKTDTYLKNKPL